MFLLFKTVTNVRFVISKKQKNATTLRGFFRLRIRFRLYFRYAITFQLRFTFRIRFIFILTIRFRYTITLSSSFYSNHRFYFWGRHVYWYFILILFLVIYTQKCQILNFQEAEKPLITGTWHLNISWVWWKSHLLPLVLPFKKAV